MRSTTACRARQPPGQRTSCCTTTPPRNRAAACARGAWSAGMGEVTRLMAEAAREAGAEIRTDVEVDEILAPAGRAAGVRLPLARSWLHRCCFRAPTRSARSDAGRGRGGAGRLSLGDRRLPLCRDEHQDQPRGQRAAAGARGGVMPYRRGIMEIASPDQHGPAQARRCRAFLPRTLTWSSASRPVHDPFVGARGTHVVTIDVNSQPYSCRRGAGRVGRDPRAGSRPGDRPAGPLLARSARAPSRTGRCSHHSTWSECWVSPAGMRFTATSVAYGSSHCGRCRGRGRLPHAGGGAVPVRLGRASRRRCHRRQQFLSLAREVLRDVRRDPRSGTVRWLRRRSRV